MQAATAATSDWKRRNLCRAVCIVERNGYDLGLRCETEPLSDTDLGRIQVIARAAQVKSIYIIRAKGPGKRNLVTFRRLMIKSAGSNRYGSEMVTPSGFVNLRV